MTKEKKVNRKDNKGKVLRKGESQRKDGTYMFRFTDECKKRKSIYAKTAQRRFASVNEIVSAVKFCIGNAFVNGAVIEVSGGYCYK